MPTSFGITLPTIYSSWHESCLIVEMSALKILLIEDRATGPLLAEMSITHGYSAMTMTASDSHMPILILANKPDLIIFNIRSFGKYYHAIQHLGALPLVILSDAAITRFKEQQRLQ